MRNNPDRKGTKKIKGLDAIWEMRRKWKKLTKEIYRWRARLNLHGGQQEFSVNYYDTYSPVVNRLIFRLRQIDLFMAYP